MSNPSQDGKLTIARLISKQQWLHLEQALTPLSGSASNYTLPIPIDDPTIPNAVTEDIVIHFAARFQAPLRTISFLSVLFPISLERPDATGRFPIHVAAKWGAAPEVVHFLIRSNPTAAGIPDDLGKTPMHYVGEFYTKNYNRKDISVNECMLQVVQMLKTAAPKSVNLEDYDGVNAIEYAIESDADLKVIRCMQRACRDDWRTMKVEGHGMKHEELEKELERIASSRQREIQSRINCTPGPSSAQNSVGSASPESPTNTPQKIMDGSLRLNLHKSTTKANPWVARTA